jgi:hypothetical protein
LVLALFGGAGVIMLVGMASRKVALRVDEKGVLLGGSPMRYRATTAFVPWVEITTVVLWTQAVGFNSLAYVGVERQPGLPPLPGPGNGRAGRAITGTLAGQVPHELVMASRGVNGWRLDREALAKAVAANAPGVPIHDAA